MLQNFCGWKFHARSIFDCKFLLGPVLDCTKTPNVNLIWTSQLPSCEPELPKSPTASTPKYPTGARAEESGDAPPLSASPSSAARPRSPSCRATSPPLPPDSAAASPSPGAASASASPARRAAPRRFFPGNISEARTTSADLDLVPIVHLHLLEPKLWIWASSQFTDLRRIA